MDTTTLNISAWFSCHIIPSTSRICESLYYLHITTMSRPNNGFEIWTMYSVWVCFVCNNEASLTIRPCQTIQHLVKARVVSYLEGTLRPWLMFRNGSLIYCDWSWFIYALFTAYCYLATNEMIRWGVEILVMWSELILSQYSCICLEKKNWGKLRHLWSWHSRHWLHNDGLSTSHRV